MLKDQWVKTVINPLISSTFHRQVNSIRANKASFPRTDYRNAAVKVTAVLPPAAVAKCWYPRLAMAVLSHAGRWEAVWRVVSFPEWLYHALVWAGSCCIVSSSSDFSKLLIHPTRNYLLLKNSYDHLFGTPDRLLAEMNKENPTHRRFLK